MDKKNKRLKIEFFKFDASTTLNDIPAKGFDPDWTSLFQVASKWSIKSDGMELLMESH